jgi:hypothetical protein
VRNLPAGEAGEHFAAGRGEAVEGPDRVVAAGHVLLELQLVGELRDQRVGARVASAGEHARLAGAAEELQPHAGVVPGGACPRLDQHRARLGGDLSPLEAPRHRQADALGERLEAGFLEQGVAERRLVQQQREMRREHRAAVLHEGKTIVVIVEKRQARAVACRGPHQGLDHCVALSERW